MWLIDRDTALFPAKSDPAEDNHSVAGFAPLVPGELPLPKLLIDRLHPSMQSVPPLERLALKAADDLKVRVQLVRRKSRSPRFQRSNQD